MVDSVPDRWRKTYSTKWYIVDEVEFITMVLPQGSWEIDTIGPVQIAFDAAGWLHWRELDFSEGGSFPPDKVVHVEWAVP